jgi:hypothetical protein
LQTANTEVPGSIPGHSLGFFWGSWVWNGVHSASWSDNLSSYLNKEVTARFGKLKMQLWDSMCWPHVNPVPSGAVGKDCQRQLLSRPRFVRACSATDLFIPAVAWRDWRKPQTTSVRIAGLLADIWIRDLPWIQSRSVNHSSMTSGAMVAQVTILPANMTGAVPWFRQLVASNCRCPGLCLCQSMQDLQWTKWHWDRFCSEFFPSVSLSSGGWKIGPLVTAVHRHSLTPIWTYEQVWCVSLSVLSSFYINKWGSKLLHSTSKYFLLPLVLGIPFVLCEWDTVYVIYINFGFWD